MFGLYCIRKWTQMVRDDSRGLKLNHTLLAYIMHEELPVSMFLTVLMLMLTGSAD